MKTSTLSKFAGATVVALIGTFAGGANAQIITPTPATPYATGLTSPSGTIQLGPNQWVADHLNGFCRLDQDPADNTKFVINIDTCVTVAASAGQPSFDRTRNFVYVPDNSSASQGVYRLKFDPATNTVLKFSRTVVANRPTLLAPNTPLLRAGGKTVRPTATAVDGAGNLYIGSIKSGNIVKITKPYVAPSDPTQTERVVGLTSDGGGVASLGFTRVVEQVNATTRVIHQDLYIAEGGAVSLLADANKCGNCGVAAALIVFPENTTDPEATREPVALTTFFNTSSRIAKVFVGLGSHDFTAREVQEYNATLDGPVFTGRTYTLPAPVDANPDDLVTPLPPVITGLGVGNNGSTLFVGDDPQVGVPDDANPPPQDQQGFLWRFSTTP